MKVQKILEILFLVFLGLILISDFAGAKSNLKMSK
jgi:hypothetical protein